MERGLREGAKNKARNVHEFARRQEGNPAASVTIRSTTRSSVTALRSLLTEFVRRSQRRVELTALPFRLRLTLSIEILDQARQAESPHVWNLDVL
jgi:hypothetical protein